MGEGLRRANRREDAYNNRIDESRGHRRTPSIRDTMRAVEGAIVQPRHHRNEKEQQEHWKPLIVGTRGVLRSLTGTAREQLQQLCDFARTEGIDRYADELTGRLENPKYRPSAIDVRAETKNLQLDIDKQLDGNRRHAAAK